MRLVKDYMNNDNMRHALNELTEKTFGFNFESWVTNGYFEGDYIQIGTVMTAKEHRNQGLARKLMENVIEEYDLVFFAPQVLSHIKEYENYGVKVIGIHSYDFGSWNFHKIINIALCA